MTRCLRLLARLSVSAPWDQPQPESSRRVSGSFGFFAQSCLCVRLCSKRKLELFLSRFPSSAQSIPSPELLGSPTPPPSRPLPEPGPPLVDFLPEPMPLGRRELLHLKDLSPGTWCPCHTCFFIRFQGVPSPLPPWWTKVRDPEQS